LSLNKSQVFINTLKTYLGFEMRSFLGLDKFDDKGKLFTLPIIVIILENVFRIPNYAIIPRTIGLFHKWKYFSHDST
jgi:hypothetical protein